MLAIRASIVPFDKAKIYLNEQLIDKDTLNHQISSKYQGAVYIIIRNLIKDKKFGGHYLPLCIQEMHLKSI